MWTLALFVLQRLAAFLERRVRARHIVVSRLFVHPIKSCGGISVPAALVRGVGLEFDRIWLLVDARDPMRFIQQREYPRLALVRPRLECLGSTYADGGRLIVDIRADDDKAIVLETAADGTGTTTAARDGTSPLVIGFHSAAEIARMKRVDTTVWSRTARGLDEGDEAAAWFSEFLGEPVRLLLKDATIARVLPPQHTPPDLLGKAEAAFSDAFPLLVASMQSLASVNSRLPTSVPQRQIYHFRPNIVVDADWQGHPTTAHLPPFAEDGWCPMPGNDMANGGKSNPRVFDTLYKFRRVDPGLKRDACFGVNGIPITENTVIRVGDKVEILEDGAAHDGKRGRSVVAKVLIVIGLYAFFAIDILPQASTLAKSVYGRNQRSARRETLFSAKAIDNSSVQTAPPSGAAVISAPVISVPLAPRTEKPLLDFVADLLRTSVAPALAAATGGGPAAATTRSPVTDAVEAALVAGVGELARKCTAFDFAGFFTGKLVPLLTRHIADCRRAVTKASKLALVQQQQNALHQQVQQNQVGIEEIMLLTCYQERFAHAALDSWKSATHLQSDSHIDICQFRDSEIEHLKSLCTRILPTMFEKDIKSPLFQSFIVEILTEKVFKALVESVSDPDFWNQMFDSMSEKAMDQEPVIAKRIAEGCSERVLENQNRETHQEGHDAHVDEFELEPNNVRIAHLVASGNFDEITLEIKVAPETLTKGDYIGTMSVKALKGQISDYHKVLKRVNRKIRSLKQSKVKLFMRIARHLKALLKKSIKTELGQLPTIYFDEILKSPVLSQHFSAFVNDRQKRNPLQPASRPNLLRILQTLQFIEDATMCLISPKTRSAQAANPDCPYPFAVSSLDANLKAESVCDLEDYYDTDDTVIPTDIANSVLDFYDRFLTPAFWGFLSGSGVDIANLKSDLDQLSRHSCSDEAEGSQGPKNADGVHSMVLNDLEPLWRLKVLVMDEIESLEYLEFLESIEYGRMITNCNDIVALILAHRHSDDWAVLERQLDRKKLSSHPKPKKVFKGLSWLGKKRSSVTDDSRQCLNEFEDEFDDEDTSERDICEETHPYTIPLKRDYSDQDSGTSLEESVMSPWKPLFTVSEDKSPEFQSHRNWSRKERTGEDIFSQESSDEENGFIKKLWKPPRISIEIRKSLARGQRNSAGLWRDSATKGKSASSSRKPKGHRGSISREASIIKNEATLLQSEVPATVRTPSELGQLTQNQSFLVRSKENNSVSLDNLAKKYSRGDFGSQYSISYLGSELSASGLRGGHLQRQYSAPPKRQETMPMSEKKSKSSSFALAAKGIIQKVSMGAGVTMKNLRALGRKKRVDGPCGYDSCPEAFVTTHKASSPTSEKVTDSADTVVNSCENTAVRLGASSDATIAKESPNANVTLDENIFVRPDSLLPSLKTPRIIELEELVENTKSELEDVVEHIADAEQSELSSGKIRALNLMKAGLEVEIKRLESEKSECKDRDIQNLISPVCDKLGDDSIDELTGVHANNCELCQQ
ncbi:hypothetical protein HDU83_005434 [Entophlyctis luteolus]|nr:hypothetical protein HDU83_005434 [Entophlyctis luteolus]